MYKRKALNYITIVFAISTIGIAIYSIKSKKDYILCSVMLIITIICNFMSNKVNDKDIDLTKEDKKMLENFKKEMKKNKL